MKIDLDKLLAKARAGLWVAAIGCLIFAIISLKGSSLPAPVKRPPHIEAEGIVSPE
jgi:hypothetical protein